MRSSQKAEIRRENSANMAQEFAAQTQKAVASARGLPVIVALLVLSADLLALTFMCLKGLYPYLLLPSILAAVDLLFVVFAAVTNFRFRYSKLLVYGYLATAVALSISIVILGVNTQAAFMSYLGAVVFLLPHLVMWCACLWSTHLARIPQFRKRRVASIVAVLTVAVGAFAFTALTGQFGSFGQHDSAFSEIRAVVYRLNENEDAYIAEGLVEGKGSCAVIEENFNGLPVEAIDCALFKTEGLKQVEIKGDDELTLLNVTEVAHASEGLQVAASKTLFEDLKDQVYACAKLWRSNEIGNFLTRLVPEVERGETYVTFAYDFTKIKSTNKPIPTFFKTKGSVFSAADLGVEYQKMYLNRDNLEWNYNSNQYRRLVAITDSNGSEIIGKKITDPQRNIVISFEPVYLVKRSYGAYKYDGAWQSTMYVTETSTKGCLAYSREGCVARWTAGSSSFTTEKEFAAYLSLLNGTQHIINLTANWSVIQPEIESVSTDAPGNTLTYGETVQVTASAKEHALALKYMLRNPSDSVEVDWTDASEFTLEGLTPNDSGVFEVVVRATDCYDSDLYAEVTMPVSLMVKKKVLALFDWQIPDGETYDCTDKPITVSLLAGQLVGEDSVELHTNLQSVKNAGDYKVWVTLDESSAERYEVSSLEGAKDFTINKRSVAVQFSSDPLVYSGKVQAPGAVAVTDIAADGILTLSVAVIEGNGRSAGTHRAHATTANQNYTLIGDEVEFEILKKEVIPVWNSTTLTYNAESQHPQVTALTGVIAGEESIGIANISYRDGNFVNVGRDYFVTAVFATNSNYCFSEGNSITCDYVIQKAPLVITSVAATKVYDGQAYSGFQIVGTGLQGEDLLSEVATAAFTGDATTAVSVNTYPILFNLTQQSKYANYDIRIDCGELSITKRPLTVSTIQKNKTYDGLTASNFEALFTGLATGDITEDVGVVDYSGTALNAINAGTYRYVCVLPEGNRGEKYSNYEITFTDAAYVISPAPLTVTVVAENEEKVYDGKTYDDWTIESSGLLQSDTLRDVALFGINGTGVTEPAVGTHTATATVVTQGEKYRNYSITYVSATVTITQRSLTVTAISGTKIYDGTSFASFSATATNLAEGDSLSDLGTLAYAGTAVSGIDVDEYSYTPYISYPGAKFGNYKITYQGAIVNITPRLITVIKTNTTPTVTKTFDGTTQTAFDFSDFYRLDGTIAGEVTGVNVTARYNAASVSDANAVIVKFGSLILGAGYKATNYTYSEGVEFTYGATITPKIISVSWGALTVNYNANTQLPTATVDTGLSDGILLCTVVATKDGRVVEPQNAGEYVVSASIQNNNYSLMGADETFTIQPFEIVAQWGESTLTYNGAAQAPIVSATGVNSENLTLGILIYKKDMPETETEAINVGEYIAVATIANDNYVLQEASKLFAFEIVAPTEVQEGN